MTGYEKLLTLSTVDPKKLRGVVIAIRNSKIVEFEGELVPTVMLTLEEIRLVIKDLIEAVNEQEGI